MFNQNGIDELLRSHGGTLKQLKEVEDHLNARFADMEQPIRALVLSVASGEPLLLVGPPGTAKSRLIRALCQCLGLLDQEMHAPANGRRTGQVTQHYFEYLLTPFTEPSELFGYFDLATAMKENELRRMDDGMMQHATVVFLDEVFNASSAILNSLLTFMNERRFHDRGTVREVALKCLFSATNQVPTTPELRAVFDRFLLRVWVDNEPDEAVRITKLIEAGWRETHGALKPPVKKGLLDRLEKFRQQIESLSRSGKLVPAGDADDYGRLSGQIRQLRQGGLSEVSNRRLVKFVRVMLIHMLYRTANGEGARGMQPEDRLLLLRFGADDDTGQLVAEINARDIAKY